MSKNWLTVQDGVTRKVKKAYSVVDGVTRKIKKGYVVVDGLTRLFYSGGLAITYTGTHTITDVTKDGEAYKLYTLTGSGTLTIDGDGSVEYWMCGGGGLGARPPFSAHGGGGGGGGYVNSGSVTANTYTVTIGAASGATSISTIATAGSGRTTSMSSEGGSGGSGGGSGGTTDIPIDHIGAGAGVSTYPFGITSLYAHCAGGGGGAYVGPPGTLHKGGNGGAGGTNGSAGNASTVSSTTTSATGGNGGTRGGGNGAQARTEAGYTASAATFYGGGGGGGGNAALEGDSWDRGDGGSGYQGVCYLLVPAELLAA